MFFLDTGNMGVSLIYVCVQMSAGFILGYVDTRWGVTDQQNCMPRQFFHEDNELFTQLKSFNNTNAASRYSRFEN